MELLYDHGLFLIVPLAAAAAALALYLRRYLLRNVKRRSSRYHPVACTVFHLFLHLPHIHDYLAGFARRYGSFRVYHLLRSYVYLVDPSDVEHLLRINFTNYCKGPFFYGTMSDLLGDGIFTIDGERWRQQRKLASFEFTTRNLRDFSSGIFRRKAIALALLLADAADSSTAVDIQDLLMRSTLDSIFKVGFGEELDTLSGSNNEGSRFGAAFDASAEVILRRFYDIFWKIKRFLNVGAEASLKEHLKVIDDFIFELIQTKAEQITSRQDATVKEDILSRFLRGSLQDETMSSKYLRDIILNLVIAGRDTTAGTLSWFFYMLCRHPDEQEKVAQEVAMATGAGSPISVEDFSMLLLSEESLEKMHYLHAALSETLRLYPAVPVDPKACLSDDILPSGYAVKKGDLVNYVPYAMGRMKNLWGEDAEEFRPRRWLDEKGVFQPESPFKFAAFQAGPRVCLGKDFAYRQMKIFAAVLLHFFCFKLKDQNEKVNYRSTLTLQIDRGLHVTAFRRAPEQP